MVEPAIFGPLDGILGPIIQYVVFILVVVNMGTRFAAHRRHLSQAEDGDEDEAVSRFLGHELTNVALILATFYYLTIHQHSGIVLSTLVLGLVLTDFFEFESRKVEARQGWELDRPKGALFASVLVLAYSAYLAFFFIVEPLWSAIV